MVQFIELDGTEYRPKELSEIDNSYIAVNAIIDGCQSHMSTTTLQFVHCRMLVGDESVAPENGVKPKYTAYCDYHFGIPDGIFKPKQSDLIERQIKSMDLKGIFTLTLTSNTILIFDDEYELLHYQANGSPTKLRKSVTGDFMSASFNEDYYSLDGDSVRADIFPDAETVVMKNSHGATFTYIGQIDKNEVSKGRYVLSMGEGQFIKDFPVENVTEH